MFANSISVAERLKQDFKHPRLKLTYGKNMHSKMDIQGSFEHMIFYCPETSKKQYKLIRSLMCLE